MERHCGTCHHFGDLKMSRTTCVKCLNAKDNSRPHWEAPHVAGANGTTANEIKPAPTPADITKVLTERGERYGKFTDHADVTQALKIVIAGYLREKRKLLANDQQEALDMICHKIGRIINGDPNYADSWVDIAGYAKLVADRLEGVSR